VSPSPICESIPHPTSLSSLVRVPTYIEEAGWDLYVLCLISAGTGRREDWREGAPGLALAVRQLEMLWRRAEGLPT